ncbi:MAG: transketolase family protein [Anaerolineaceae bacterium]|nr:transketolase family protein [Anaerolineaceae bacterium]
MEKEIKKSQFVGKSSRDAYGKALVELGEKDERVVAVTADLAGSVRMTEFKKRFPKRFFDFGIAEQDMMGASAGLAITGKIPYTSTYAVFASLRAGEQVRTDIAYNKLPVRICATHSGIGFGVGGATHQSLEDIGIFRAMPGMTVLVPADGVETAAMMRETLQLSGPVYLRLARPKEQTVYEQDFKYQIGKADILIEGKDIAILACGGMVGRALGAANLLKESGINASVMNVSTIKPIDKEAIIKVAESTGVILTVEEHSIINGLGSAVAEVIAEAGIKVGFKRHGILDVFTTSGPYEDLLTYYSLDAKGIAETAQNFLA